MGQHLNVNQWKNPTSVMKWLSALENKNDCIFIIFDIQEFYPPITDYILKTSLSFANEYQDIKKIHAKNLIMTQPREFVLTKYSILRKVLRDETND